MHTSNASNKLIITNTRFFLNVWFHVFSHLFCDWIWFQFLARTTQITKSSPRSNTHTNIGNLKKASGLCKHSIFSALHISTTHNTGGNTKEVGYLLAKHPNHRVISSGALAPPKINLKQNTIIHTNTKLYPKQSESYSNKNSLWQLLILC